MMKAEELRIGNWVKVTAKGGYNNIGDLIKVSSINSWSGINEWSDMGTSGSNRFEGIEPIPLTPEILEKAGFWKSKHGWFELLPFTRFTVEFFEPAGNGVCVYSGFDDKLECNIICTAEYLHQLQNAFYCFTGKELEIKL